MPGDGPVVGNSVVGNTDKSVVSLPSSSPILPAPGELPGLTKTSIKDLIAAASDDRTQALSAEILATQLVASVLKENISAHFNSDVTRNFGLSGQALMAWRFGLDFDSRTNASDYINHNRQPTASSNEIRSAKIGRIFYQSALATALTGVSTGLMAGFDSSFSNTATGLVLLFSPLIVGYFVKRDQSFSELKGDHAKMQGEVEAQIKAITQALLTQPQARAAFGLKPPLLNDTAVEAILQSALNSQFEESDTKESRAIGATKAFCELYGIEISNGSNEYRAVLEAALYLAYKDNSN